MATSRGRARAQRDTATGDTRPGQVPELSFDESDYRLARDLRPDLYYQITQDYVAFEHIARAWWIRNDPARRVGEKEKKASQVLEYLARKEFKNEHQCIRKDYWEKKPWGGCALTGDGCVHSVMNSDEPELILYDNRIHQLCRDAHRTFATAAQRSKAGDGDQQPGKGHRRAFAGIFRRRSGPLKAERDLMEVGEMLYSVLTHVIYAGSVLEDEHATPRQREEALAAVRLDWKTVKASVEDMIQRQARFEYFEGVGLGVLVTIPVLAVAGWLAIRYGVTQFSEPGRPGSLSAATIGGAAGAVISVTQRMTAKDATLVLDFTASKSQKVALGALRPIVGAVFGAVIYFAVIGGLLAVAAKTGTDASVALAFFAVAGFAAGFSERFATDVLQRASSGLGPATQDKDAGKSDELSQLLSELPRHAGTRSASGQDGTAAPASDPRKRPRRRWHSLSHRPALPGTLWRMSCISARYQLMKRCGIPRIWRKACRRRWNLTALFTTCSRTRVLPNSAMRSARRQRRRSATISR
jgi:hypothetical protein